MFGAVDLRLDAPSPSSTLGALDRLTAVVWDAARKRRVLLPMIWGLLPSWETHPDAARVRPLNARAETVATSRMFSQAFARRRCLVAVDGWDGRADGGAGRSESLGNAGRPPVALGGIWESWRGPHRSQLRTLAIVTIPAASGSLPAFGRMPLVLGQADWPLWLGEVAGDAAALLRVSPDAGGAIPDQGLTANRLLPADAAFAGRDRARGTETAAVEGRRHQMPAP
jgi:putative SOS response-associated peptidase YedK